VSRAAATLARLPRSDGCHRRCDPHCRCGAYRRWCQRRVWRVSATCVEGVSDVCGGRWADNALALYKGGIARVIRSSPQFAVTLAAYELLHKHFPYPFAPQELTTPRPTRAIAQDIVSFQDSRCRFKPAGYASDNLRVMLTLGNSLGSVRGTRSGSCWIAVRGSGWSTGRRRPRAWRRYRRC
jgi:hypothetical protein